MKKIDRQKAIKMETIRQIQIFLCLAEELHFAKAAQLLEITQPTLSKEVRKLEAALGCQLFDRSDKWKITLTSAGEAYLRQVKTLPDELAAAGAAARRAASGERKTLSLVVSGAVYEHIHLGGILQKMHRKHPEVRLKINDSLFSSQALIQTRNGKFDVALFSFSGTLPAGDRQLNIAKLKRAPFAFAIPAAHPLAIKSDLQLKDFVSAQFILPSAEEAPLLRQHFEKVFSDECGKLPKVSQEALGIRATRQLVSAGLGIGIVQQPRQKDDREKIVYRELPFKLERYIAAGWNSENRSKVLRDFITMLIEDEADT